MGYGRTSCIARGPTSSRSGDFPRLAPVHGRSFSPDSPLGPGELRHPPRPLRPSAFVSAPTARRWGGDRECLGGQGSASNSHSATVPHRVRCRSMPTSRMRPSSVRKPSSSAGSACQSRPTRGGPEVRAGMMTGKARPGPRFRTPLFVRPMGQDSGWYRASTSSNGRLRCRKTQTPAGCVHTRQTLAGSSRSPGSSSSSLRCSSCGPTGSAPRAPALSW